MNERNTDCGPYETEAQALAAAAPLTAAIHAADPGHGPMTQEIRAARLQARVDYLTAALERAGVELGAYDRRIAAWLADMDTWTLQVVVGWIGQAHAAGNLAANWAHHVAAAAAEAAGECAKPVHWAIDGRAACRSGSLSDPMTRVASGATCDACRALIPGGAS